MENLILRVPWEMKVLNLVKVKLSEINGDNKKFVKQVDFDWRRNFLYLRLTRFKTRHAKNCSMYSKLAPILQRFQICQNGNSLRKKRHIISPLRRARVSVWISRNRKLISTLRCCRGSFSFEPVSE